MHFDLDLDLDAREAFERRKKWIDAGTCKASFSSKKVVNKLWRGSMEKWSRVMDTVINVFWLIVLEFLINFNVKLELISID